MKATCIKYNNTLDNYREKDKSHVFKNLQYTTDHWKANYNSNCIGYADDRCMWIVGAELEDFVENVYNDLLDDYIKTYYGICKNKITLYTLCMINDNFYKLLRNYIK